MQWKIIHFRDLKDYSYKIHMDKVIYHYSKKVDWMKSCCQILC